MKQFLLSLVVMTSVASAQSIDQRSLKYVQRSLKLALKANNVNNSGGVDANVRNALATIAQFIQTRVATVTVSLERDMDPGSCDGARLERATPQDYRFVSLNGPLRQAIDEKVLQECDRKYLSCEVSRVKIRTQFVPHTGGSLVTSLGRCFITASVDGEE